MAHGYGDVPPLPETVTVAEPPLQRMDVAEALEARTVGSVTVIEVVPVHPFASVIV